MASAQSSSTLAETPKTKPFTAWSIVDIVLDLLSSVPFGIVLLILLVTACMIGMLIQQQELETFARYYAELTPAEKIIYGKLGFFDIYHANYFNVLLLLLSLTIILASIDHFPKAWSFVARKKLTASPLFAKSQRTRDEVALPGVGRAALTERTARAAKATGFKVKITAEENRTTVFAERGAWNRLGAYLVHISLLTIFTGGFLTSRGHTGMMPVQPQKSSDRMMMNVFNVDNATLQHLPGVRELELPFTIEGVDIEQKLINNERGIDAGNTLDWITRVRINDKETGQTTEALIHLNHPFDYRGYRFFQASFNPLGNARSLKLRATPAQGGDAQEVNLTRDGQAKLSDGTVVRIREFNPSFTVNRDGRATLDETTMSDYSNPAVHLDVVYPDGDNRDVWAFTEAGRGFVESAPFLKSKFMDTGAYQFTLLEFEKVPSAHHLSIQYDPGVRVVYAGFLMICLSLMAVFFFSHQRLWLVVEDGKVTLGGDANRNRLGFEDRMKKLVARLRGEQPSRAAN